MAEEKKKITKKPSGKKPVSKKTEEINNLEAKKKRVRHSYIYAVGRRKKAIARVRLYKNGEGKIIINEKELEKYFSTPELQKIVKQPLEVVGKLKDFNFTIKVEGGGSKGQAESCRHGIARTLLLFDKSLKPNLKAEGYLKRDPRRKERKKPGLKRARRAPQWSKR